MRAQRRYTPHVESNGRKYHSLQVRVYLDGGVWWRCERCGHAEENADAYRKLVTHAAICIFGPITVGMEKSTTA